MLGAKANVNYQKKVMSKNARISSKLFRNWGREDRGALVHTRIFKGVLLPLK